MDWKRGAYHGHECDKKIPLEIQYIHHQALNLYINNKCRKHKIPLYIAQKNYHFPLFIPQLINTQIMKYFILQNYFSPSTSKEHFK